MVDAFKAPGVELFNGQMLFEKEFKYMGKS